MKRITSVLIGVSLVLTLAGCASAGRTDTCPCQEAGSLSATVTSSAPASCTPASSSVTHEAAFVHAAAASRDKADASRVVFIVDNSAYPALKDRLERYATTIQRERGVTCEALPDDYYHMKPAEIREILKHEYATSDPPLVGAIMVGPIPHACRSYDPSAIMIPCSLYYEDFDAVYVDKDGNGAFSDDEITNDRVTNPTEIWVSWWVPPSMDASEQVEQLKFFLDKLDQYYKGTIVGRDQMLWAAGNVVKVEDVEGWSVLLKDAIKPLDQKLVVWSKIGQDTGTFRPNKRKDEHGPTDFVKAFTLQPWQHMHVIAHGNQRGWYWDNTGVCVARKAGGEPDSEYSLLLKLDQYDKVGANIITTSGCSNGNFRGDYVGPNYDHALPNIMLFSPHTITVAWYGAASPQSTSGFACMVTELIEGLKPDRDSYLAEGYYRMKNHDYSWGLQHYFFRGGDEKILLGDPFARYQDSPPFTAEQKEAIQKKIDSAKWEVTGDW